MLNPIAPLCYLGIDEDTPHGKMIYTVFNQVFTTVAGITAQDINISSNDPFFLTGILVQCSTATVQVKPYDGEGEEIFTDFFLSNPAGTDPFPLMPPRPFNQNDSLRFDTLDAGGGHIVEVAFVGYTLSGVAAPGGRS